MIGHEIVLELIAATTNRGGLIVHAEADPNAYPRGRKVTDVQMAAIAKIMKPHTFPRRGELYDPPGIKTSRPAAGRLRRDRPPGARQRRRCLRLRRARG